MVRGISTVFIIIVVLIATGCNRADIEKKQITLTVNAPSESMFFERAGIAFESRYPNIKIKVVNYDWRKEEFSPQAPDIVLMRNLREYHKAINEGELLNLDHYYSKMMKEQMQLSDITTSLLRWEADNGLYGLSPSFDSSVIYFNKGMFDQFDVPYPTNQMSWQELMNLVQLFPEFNQKGERIYGFKSNYYEHISFATFLRVGQTEGLSFIDPSTLEININTEKWREIGTYIVQAFQSGKVYSDHIENAETYIHSPIFTGQAAMELSSQTTAYNFDTVHKQFELEDVEWEMVTVPVNPLRPEYSDYYQLNEIYGISKSSLNQKEAWDFIEFITSDTEYYKQNKNQIINYGVPAKLEWLEPIESHDLSPLTLLRPELPTNNPYDNIHFEIIHAFKEVGQALFNQVLDGSLPLEEALERIKLEGQLMVDVTRERLEEAGEAVFYNTD